MTESTSVFIGIDVQLVRDLAYTVMDSDGRVIDNGWLDSSGPRHAAELLADKHPAAVVGIDAPRVPLRVPRQHYWAGGSWRRKRSSDKGFGRHCEVVISACGLARPQWTPTSEQARDWMVTGFELFRGFDAAGLETEEVFPSAAYRMLAQDMEAQVQIPLKGFLPGPKDMLDSIIAAFTVKEFIQGRGCAVGGGDGLGVIVLPRPIDHPNAGRVGIWPDQ